MKLEVHNLSFTYPGTTKKALRGINLVIEPGEQLAIVGLNGGGKTTLVKVLMGLYDAKGSLSVNDLPIESYDPVSIHKRTSCLFQDFGQYELTLRENVGIGDLRYLEEDAKLELALERGGASEVVTKTGLDGPLDPWYAPDRKQKAQALSGGQWQRVALARAFLKSDDADLVVFDEPSSSLDPKAEAELFQKIHSLSMRGGRKITTIYISHRFSTVRRADKIAVVENGTIIELGTHDELMRLGGRYQELFKLSKDGFEDSYPGRNNQEAPFTSSESP
ncbi:P-loop containing nucleoside triphosphate hydrolase protein [Kockovaella imperatae]|uniref:p-loop containing nucleoside triphosphate hydrolase protein n=1 Tax=Kockovaella imperatae TaxID=4999 RepID=A0A1Y1UAG4_9TREE|nr:P-loop containing nucleoside triphosphate hydrolase protein [Kockovaella imperatae]ORX35028.1 P-loop containing nucleoside triphosphate hydrolase protein [Kockovaella imperatae]